MPEILKRTVSKLERFTGNPEIGEPSWDDIRVFLVCVEEVSLRKAANALGTSTSTLTRRIDRMEKALGVRLFKRLPEGIVLTDEGASLLEAAQAMGTAANAFMRTRLSMDDDEKGEVTVSITEGIGSYWVMPKVLEFNRSFPQVSLNLRCAMDSADVLRQEADVSIQFVRPENPDLKVCSLGFIHIYPFAAQSYLDIYGTPVKDQDLIKHRFVQQVAPQIDDSVFLDYFTHDIKDNIALRTNGSAAHFHAVMRGSVIGALPTYIYALGAPLVPLDIDNRTSYPLELWMTYHPDVKKVSRKALTIEWLKDIFDTKMNPWFREEFVHPSELLKYVSDDMRLFRESSYLL
ncbi:MAG: LysR family transcriptional regulator [Methyloligellaceae bacterium]